MALEDIHQILDRRLELDRRTGSTEQFLEALLEEVGRATDQRIIRALVEFIYRYVQAAPDLLEYAVSQPGLAAARPACDAAIAYWTRPQAVADEPGLVGLIDDAYVSNRIVQSIAQEYSTERERRRLPRNLQAANSLIHELFAPTLADTLDLIVSSALESGSEGIELDPPSGESVSRRTGAVPIEMRLRVTEEHLHLVEEGALAGFLLTAMERGAIEDSETETGEATGDEQEREILRGEEHEPSGPRRRVEGGHEYRVWYATNRAPNDADDLSRGFANIPDPDQRVHHGVCRVFVPKGHKPGSTGSKWFQRWRRLKFKDDESLQLIENEPLGDADSLFGEIRAELEANPEARHLVVYIHGYKNSFEDAALRAAQLGFDLNVEGEMAFFSWPSCARPLRYNEDRERIEDSEEEIAAFLKRAAEDSGAEAVHVIAHSMGNRGLARVASQALADSGVRFANIILAAPDIQPTLFARLAEAYPRIADRTTLYASPRDLALEASELLQGDRVGLVPPVTVVPNIDTVKVSQFNLLDLGHGYFATAKALISDMFQLIRYGEQANPPRALLVPEEGEAGTYWVLQ